MNCLCNLLDNDIVWIILLILVLAGYCHSQDGNMGGCGRYSNGNGCGCGCS